MSWTDGPLLGFDLETTSVDPMTALPVSFAFCWYDNGRKVKGKTGLINPGIPIPPETTAIHGITDEMVQERGGTLLNSINGITEILIEASAQAMPVVGMNVSYDLTIVDQRLRSFIGSEGGLRDYGWNGPVIDVSVIDRRVDKWRKGSRKLTDLCTHYGVTLDKAHTAGADAQASVEVAIAQAAKYKQINNADAEMLYVQQAGWRREWARDFNEYLAKNDKPPLEVTAGNWPLATDEGIPAP